MKWTPEEVALRFEEALLTLQKLPQIKIRGYFSTMPAVLRTLDEVAFMEPRPIKLKATSQQITDLEEALRWLEPLGIKERKVIWHKAARRPWKVICWDCKLSRTVAWEYWKKALFKIASKLNSEGKKI